MRQIGSAWIIGFPTLVPVVTSNISASAPALPITHLPSRLNEALEWRYFDLRIEDGGLPRWMLKTCAVPSCEQVRSDKPSGVNPRSVTGPSCSNGSLMGRPLSASQILTTPLLERVATLVPSGLMRK